MIGRAEEVEDGSEVRKGWKTPRCGELGALTGGEVEIIEIIDTTLSRF